MNTQILGDQVYQIISATRGALFKLGELTQLSYEAFENTAQVINKRTEEKITLKYPIGQKPDGEPMAGESQYDKATLIKHYVHLANVELPLTGIYSIVTHTENMFSDIIHVVVRKYPQKLSGKRTMPMSTILNCDTLEGLHIAAINSLIHELSYKSPREFAEDMQKIISCNLLELPAYHRYIEVKATRDIYMHNRGIANDIYIKKAGSHARVKAGFFLPMNTQYFLSAYETGIQLTELLQDELHNHWPSPEYETFKNRLQEKNKETDST